MYWRKRSRRGLMTEGNTGKTTESPISVTAVSEFLLGFRRFFGWDR